MATYYIVVELQVGAESAAEAAAIALDELRNDEIDLEVQDVDGVSFGIFSSVKIEMNG
jgi:hypothetical protein